MPRNAARLSVATPAPTTRAPSTRTLASLCWRASVAVVPLGTPLLAGPGAISTVILYAQRYSSVAHYLSMVVVIVALTGCTLLLFRMAPTIHRLFGRTGINIVTRLMGLIMAAMGVEFIAHGLRQLFPVLAG